MEIKNERYIKYIRIHSKTPKSQNHPKRMIDERIKEYLAYTFPSNHFQKYFPPQIDKHGISGKIPFSPIFIYLFKILIIIIFFNSRNFNFRIPISILFFIFFISLTLFSHYPPTHSGSLFLTPPVIHYKTDLPSLILFFSFPLFT